MWDCTPREFLAHRSHNFVGGVTVEVILKKPQIVKVQVLIFRLLKWIPMDVYRTRLNFIGPFIWIILCTFLATNIPSNGVSDFISLRTSFHSHLNFSSTVVFFLCRICSKSLIWIIFPSLANTIHSRGRIKYHIVKVHLLNFWRQTFSFSTSFYGHLITV